MSSGTMYGRGPTGQSVPLAVDSAGQLLTVSGGAAVVAVTLTAVEGDTGGGTGYSEGEILLLRQEGTNAPFWFNTATQANIAAPTNTRQIGGGATVTASSPTPTRYQIDGTGPVLFGIVDPDANTIDPFGPAVAIAIGTGAGEAQLLTDVDVELQAEFLAIATRAPDYADTQTILRLAKTTGDDVAISYLNVNTGTEFTTAPTVGQVIRVGATTNNTQVDPVRYQLNNGTIGTGWYDRANTNLYSDVNLTIQVPIGTNPTDANAALIQGTAVLGRVISSSTPEFGSFLEATTNGTVNQPAIGGDVVLTLNPIADADMAAELVPNRKIIITILGIFIGSYVVQDTLGDQGANQITIRLDDSANDPSGINNSPNGNSPFAPGQAIPSGATVSGRTTAPARPVGATHCQVLMGYETTFIRDTLTTNNANDRAILLAGIRYSFGASNLLTRFASGTGHNSELILSNEDAENFQVSCEADVGTKRPQIQFNWRNGRAVGI